MKSSLSPQAAAFLEHYERLAEEDKRALEHMASALAKLRALEMQLKYQCAAKHGLRAEVIELSPDVKDKGA
jgi:hypothetical protein